MELGFFVLNLSNVNVNFLGSFYNFFLIKKNFVDLKLCLVFMDINKFVKEVNKIIVNYM